MSLTRHAAALVFILGGSPAGAIDAGLLPPALGLTEVVRSHPLSGHALDGFDAVSYFLPGGPQPGSPDLEVLWAGVAWRFASRANQETFLHDPEIYAPRLGGHDPLAALSGRVVAGDPLIHAVSDGRLYLFRTRSARDVFLASPSGIDEAETNWRRMAGLLVQP